MRQEKYFMKYLLARLRPWLQEVCDSVIEFYQITVSPDHGLFAAQSGFSRCRFYPSCSNYAKDAVRQYGLIKGIVVSLKRLARCHPWHQGGYDPA